MNEFPSLDDFSVTEYGDVHLVDPRVVNVLQVAGKAHIEYCYENEDMLCSIDSNPEDGMWRWMIIQRRPCLYMDDGNLGGTEDLMTAYEEAKSAYLSHRETMERLRQRLGQQDDGLTGPLNGDVVVQMPGMGEDEMDYSASHPKPLSYEGTVGTHYASAPQHAYESESPVARPQDSGSYDIGVPPQGTSIYDPLRDMASDTGYVSATDYTQGYSDSARHANAMATDAAYADADYVEQTPLAAFDEFDDMLDKFFAQDIDEMFSGAPDQANVDFGGNSDSSIFDMDIDEFLGLDQTGESGQSPNGSHIDATFNQLIESGLNAGNPRFGRGIRGDPE